MRQEKEIKEEQPVEKTSYEAPKMKKHDPVKIVQGSGSCGGLYYTSLYYSY